MTEYERKFSVQEILNCTIVTERIVLYNTLTIITCGEENKVCKKQRSLENTAEWNEKL
jgi:hypothetical protein